ncbi:ribulose-phosphate 3-epimerase isoform X2 [Hylobates moloch]|uniref:ribulose-phosphate 3-epimerase isoform X2 n=1 Tax=Hylobates moloch TaxID=81572 RepID=UPI0026754F18|nr:ribulose-phosphate 3-epimerase isoform X2 [Hylobates moloch]
MASGCKIGPSILNSDLANLGAECLRMLDSGADYLHLDVMDGHPALQGGQFFAFCSQHHLWSPCGRKPSKAARPGPFLWPGVVAHAYNPCTSGSQCERITCGQKFETSLGNNMHMMVSKPEQWVKPMAVAGANQYTFHLEATENPGALIKDIRENGMKVGLAIKPGTSVEYLAPWANQIDMALVMTVEPGFGGQKFMEDMMPKVHWLRTQFPSLDIEVDGGVGPDTVHKCAECGVSTSRFLYNCHTFLLDIYLSKA